MPELPDITVYVDALAARVIGGRLVRASVRSPFLLRTFEPPLESLEGSAVTSVHRQGKRIVIGLERERFLVLHLMIAGRLLWKPAGTRPKGKIDSAALEFAAEEVPPELAGPPVSVGAVAESGTLLVTEAGTTKRAAMHVIEGRAGVSELDPGGVEPLTCTPDEFSRSIRRENRTLKRVLTSPALFSGIGNAYSDEILHAARLSPVKRTGSVDDAEMAQLFDATRSVLLHWTQRLREQFGLIEPTTGTPPAAPMSGSPPATRRGRFPRTGEITAFRPDFAVHGKFGKRCPVCGSIVQRIVRAENEVNYCPGCQTGGRLLADRSLSRLLKDDWPATAEEWEQGR